MTSLESSRHKEVYNGKVYASACWEDDMAVEL